MQRQHNHLRRWATLLLLAGLVLSFGPIGRPVAIAAPTVILQSDFEDGTAQGWVPQGAVTLAATTEAAHGGTHSLKTTGRTADWNGPSRDLRLLLQKGVTYVITGYVRLPVGQPASTLKATIKRTPSGGTATYEQVAASATNGVTDAGWVELRGQYAFSTDVDELVLYFESADPTGEFYLDDLMITTTETPPPDQSGLASTFETGTVEGWTARGDDAVAVTTEAAHGGTYSLKSSGRTQTWNGPSRDVLGKLSKGAKYNISVWVKLAAGEPTTELRLSLQRTYQGTTNYDTIVPNTAVTADQWVRLSTDYTMAYDVDALTVYVESASGLASFYIDDFALTFVPLLPVQTDIPSVKDVLADYFPIGAAIPASQTADIHADLLKKHFNSITAENAMKWEAIEPQEGQFTWTEADAIVQFTRDNGMMIRGHTLVWHSQVPAWVFQDASGNPLQPSAESKALVLQRMENHIRALAGRYKDDIYAWDVVNEVIEPSEAGCMRQSPWYTLTGLDFIRTAFRVAREVAPNAKLFINDYNTEQVQKRDCLYNLVRDLRAEGVPIDGVGHQMHINIDNPSLPALENMITKFIDLGVEQHITELDVSIYTNSTDSYTTVPQEIMIKQGYRYKEVFDLLRRYKSEITSVTLWGVSDDHTWLKSFPITRLDLPLLFDEQLQAKHAYWGIVNPSKLPPIIQRLNVTQGTPAIDGAAELLWSGLPTTTLPPTTTLGASFKALWDAGHLYVLADVQDSTVDAGDTVELFIDENNAKTDTYQEDDARYSIPRSGAATIPASVRPLPGGYRVEAAIPLKNAAALKRAVGFDLRVTDASGAQRVISWNDPTRSQNSDTSKFGTLTLVERQQTADVLPGTPQVDAVEEAAWRDAEPIRTGVWVQGTSGATATLKLLWDANHLYVLAHVRDPLLSKSSSNPWEQDSLELFVDQNNAKTSSYQNDDGQYRVNYANERSFGGGASTERFVSATRVVSDGYVVEAAIRLDAIQPQPGALVGFDAQVNDDSTGTGARSSVVTWSDPTGQSYQSASRLGVLRLLAAPSFTQYLPMVRR
ncbi:MAG TPA: endo-1,4-beta-xylanase [Roseiflexaceae bacterium]|nr:endo-1,4-beta-xylanase [Roseiflexaceae bacterium]